MPLLYFLNTTGNVLDNTRKLLLKDIYSPAVVLLVFMLLPIQNMTGVGMADWLAAISKAILNNRKQI